MDAGGILATVFENLFRLLPFRMEIIHSYEQGVKFRGGNDINRCNSTTGIKLPVIRLVDIKGIPVRIPYILEWKRTGIHFYWAWFESIEVECITEKVMETQYQTVITSDNKEITISLTINYQITNVRKYWVIVQSGEYSMENLCQGFLTKVVSTQTLEDLTKNPSVMEDAFLEMLNEKVYKWGMRVNYCYLVNVTKARAFRLFTNEL